MTKLEKEIEKKLTAMVKSHGGLCLKWVCPGWSGVPDRIVLLPGGRVIFVETKRPKGSKVSELQKWWNDKLTALGFYACFVFNEQHIEELKEIIEAFGDCTRCAYKGQPTYEEPCIGCSELNDRPLWKPEEPRR